jgi:hypothetical protein
LKILNKDINLLLGVSGSIATIKLELIIENLMKANKNIKLKIIFTEKSKTFTNLEKL